MKKMMVLFIILLGIRGQAESSDRGVIEVTEIKKFKSRSPKKSLYKFSGRVLVGENDCLAEGVKLKYRRFLEEEVDLRVVGLRLAVTLRFVVVLRFIVFFLDVVRFFAVAIAG